MAVTSKTLPLRPVLRETVQDHVYRQLKDLILNGGIEPGRTVTIQSLADAFGVSAMPVREALHRLVAEKALTVVAGRSVGIPPLSVERLEDLKRVRIEIEGVATEWAARSISAADLERLDALMAEMEAAHGERDGRRYVPANREFHFTIYRAAGSASMLSIIESLWLRIGPYFDLLNSAGSLGASNAEHRAIRDALLRGDGPAARAALKADIEGAAKALTCILEAQASG
ncbi:GntR family transcriptional regulator [Skermanella pratensis]|uniref:GntR family transcriptional regulator n=1 Tax=Skermanella pratensis TaxID=2233999 RepID=UPI001300FE63|nr:GntR family transcriptional regulator [Skermanella pratensis]